MGMEGRLRGASEDSGKRERKTPKKYKTKKEQVISKEVVQKVGRSNLWDERKSFGVLRQVLKSGGDADDRIKHWMKEEERVAVVVIVMVVEVVMLVDEQVWKWKLEEMVSVAFVMGENM